MTAFYHLLGDYFQAKNEELIYNCHPREAVSCNLVPSKRQTFVSPRGEEYLNVGRSLSG